MKRISSHVTVTAAIYSAFPVSKPSFSWTLGLGFHLGGSIHGKIKSQWDTKFAKFLGALAEDPAVPLAPARALPGLPPSSLEGLNPLARAAENKRAICNP